MKSPLHLYIHIPYCLHKCAYCDFNSHASSSPPWQGYFQALGRELRYWSGREQFMGRPLSTIFLGGGTPSLAPPSLVAGLIEEAGVCFGLEERPEISLEANPGAIEHNRFSGFRAAGINRLSIGVQSFHDAELRWLERIHTAEEAREAFRLARLAGFANINLDLMYGLPGQKLDEWLASLEKAIELGPEHLACYQLTVEPHTLLAVRHDQRPLNLPEDDKALKFFHATRNLLAKAGYEAYEVSNFARAGFSCRHNDGYWQYHDYIGIGAGACGKWDTKDGGICRYSNIRRPETYITASESGKAIRTMEQLGRSRAAAEAVWLGLRRLRGISRDRFSSRFGTDVWNLFSRQLEPWRTTGHLHLSKEHLYLNASGLELADSIALSII
jgi:oxygen-independent coproporphyrinogen-3 oxidase